MRIILSHVRFKFRAKNKGRREKKAKYSINNFIRTLHSLPTSYFNQRLVVSFRFTVSSARLYVLSPYNNNNIIIYSRRSYK